MHWSKVFISVVVLIIAVTATAGDVPLIVELGEMSVAG
jgi:hypothetical protein